MEHRSQIFIYERRELLILILLATTVAVFAFTLGVHLGKRVHSPAEFFSKTTAHAPVETAEDQLPTSVEISDQVTGIQRAARDILDETIKNEVSRTGVKLEPHRQVSLPEKTASANKGATTLITALENAVKAIHRKTPEKKYTLQVGSYPRLSDAQDRIEALEALQLEPYLRVVDLGKKGRWYRIFLGGFDSKKEAEDFGQRYKSRNTIESYIVAVTPH